MHSLWHVFWHWSIFLDFVNISSPKMKEELFLDVVITIFQNIFLSFPKNVELLDFSFILPERNAGYKYCHYWILFKIVGILRWLFWNIKETFFWDPFHWFVIILRLPRSNIVVKIGPNYDCKLLKDLSLKLLEPLFIDSRLSFCSKIVKNTTNFHLTPFGHFETSQKQNN